MTNKKINNKSNLTVILLVIIILLVTWGVIPHIPLPGLIN